jgi:AraC family transcriptional regulator of adaptative response / DNA-3-methyladenine glycosylase II
MEHDADTLYRAYTTRDARFDGRVFAGVRTTGIYCRPVCPARMPKRENMTFFPTAAAAQAAGYRPCLRCRPESAPDFAGWRGTSPVVHRALALIEDGWLEDRDIDGLAGEVGVSDRQLRRLFREQLGATPIAVAQTRRVLLAKQLIHETDLPMADVAMASGFGSVRRFNETFQRLFDRPPAALRRQRPTAMAAAAGIVVRLAYRPPFDWEALLGYLARSAIPGVEHAAAGRYARTIRFGEHSGWVAVRQASRDQLELTVHFPDLEALPRIIRRVRRRLDLSADPLAIGGQLAEDPLLAPLVAARPGLRVPGVWDGFEEAVRAIAGSDHEALRAVVIAYGRPIDDPAAQEAGLSHAFPEPSKLTAITAEDVPPLPHSRAAAALAAAVVARPTLLEQHRDPDLTCRQLADLEGFDDDLRTTITARVLEGYDTIPPDTGLLASGPDAPFASEAELRQRARNWSPWRAYGVAYLLTDANHRADA